MNRRLVAAVALAGAAFLTLAPFPTLAAPDREARHRWEFQGKLRRIRAEAAQEHLQLGSWCRDAGLVAQATAEFLRAVEVGEGQNPGALKVLDLMRSRDDKFWRAVNPHPSKAYLDTYEKKAGALEEARQEALHRLARDARKQGLEEEALGVWTGLLRDADAPLRFDAKEQVVLAVGELPPDVSARIKSAAIDVNGQLYLRDAFLDLIPQVKEIREASGARVRVRCQGAVPVPSDLRDSLEALLPFLEEDLGGRPSRRMTVFVFQDRPTYAAWLDAAKLSRFAAASGLADGATNTAIVCAAGIPADALRGMAMHELAHLFHYGVTPVVMPSWYSEGFAESYGGPGTVRWDAGKLEAGLPMDAARLAPLATDTGYLPLADLLKGDALKVLTADRARGSRFYAASWAFLRYMRTAAGPEWTPRFRLWETLCRGAALGAQAGKPRDADTAPATAAFERLFGPDLARIEEGFRAWLSR